MAKRAADDGLQNGQESQEKPMIGVQKPAASPPLKTEETHHSGSDPVRPFGKEDKGE
jgi:hypothetical protein